MKIKHLVTMAIAATAISFSQAVKPAQAAVLGGGNGTPTCAKVSNNYFIDCAGYFEGNDKGAQGTGLANLNNLFSGGTWSFAGDSDTDNKVSVFFGSNGADKKLGTATTSLSGIAGAIAVKAGNSYSLYKVADLGNFSWSTAGVKPVGQKGNTPELSHISIYTQDNGGNPPQSVPEPSLLLSLVGVAGVGTRLKQRNKR